MHMDIKKDHTNNSAYDVWLDFLCWESALFVFFKIKQPISSIYYCQISRLFKPFIYLYMRLTGYTTVEINDTILGEERINEESAYEYLHTKIKEVLITAGKIWSNQIDVKKMVSENNFDPTKIIEHLKESAFQEIYRPIELSIIASLKSNDRKILVLKRSPFIKLFSNTIPLQVAYYRIFFSHIFHITKRKNYIYDQFVTRIYFAGRFFSSLKMIIRWFLLAITICMSKFFPRFKATPIRNNSPNIGVDYWQRRYRPDEMNEVFWINESQIPKHNFYSFEIWDFDKKSQEEFAKIGINRVRLLKNPLEFFRFFSKYNKIKQSNCHYLTPDIHFLLTIPKLLINLFQYGFYNYDRFWIAQHLIRFQYSVQYWGNIYRQLNIQLVSSIVDTDTEKLAKAQSLENINGFFTGSHWSNFPMIRVDNQKCYDVLLTWGNHFINNVLNSYPSMLKIVVGYPLDYSYKFHAAASKKIHDKYPHKYKLLYVDNIIAHDLPYSIQMQLDLCKMFCELLDEYNNLIVFIKPKKIHIFKEVVNNFPSLVSYLNSNRIVLFHGTETGEKLCPAKIGMASDLTIGLGISSAAAECHFAGTPAFHADLTNFAKNAFANAGDGKIVFRDIPSLKQAVRQQINKGQQLNTKEFKKYYNTLDPFQDSQSYLRIGIIMKILFDLIKQGSDRLTIAKMAYEKYETFTKKR